MKKLSKPIDTLFCQAAKLPDVHNYFITEQLPENWCWPEKILAFYHHVYPTFDRSHRRHTLVLPFEPMTYYIDERRFELTPETALYIPPFRLRHVGFKKPEASYRRLLVTFETPLAEAPNLPQKPLLALSDTAVTLAEAFLRNYSGGELPLTTCRLAELLYELARNPMENQRPDLSPEIEHAASYIQNHLSEPFGIQEVADFVHLSESRLRARFRSEIHVSIGHYIAEQRFAAATTLLSTTSHKLDEVAKACGFTSQSSFSRFFHNRAQIAPLAYRSARKTEKGL